LPPAVTGFAATNTKAMTQGAVPFVHPVVDGALLHQHVAGLEVHVGAVELHVDLA
jgi:hypothetical protein